MPRTSNGPPAPQHGDEVPAARGPRPPARRMARFVARSSLTLVLLTVCYYLVPAAEPTGADAGVRWAGSAVALCGFVVLVRRSLRGARRERTPLALAEAVLTVLYVLLLMFALTYCVIALRLPGQFHGIENHTDALYFTVTVAGTVGFGDITPVETPARLVVTAQMLANLIYLGVAVRVLSQSAPRASTAPPPDAAA